MYDREILVAYLSKLPVGKTIQVEFRRDGKYQTVPVVLKDISTAPKKPAAGSAPAAEPAQPRLPEPRRLLANKRPLPPNRRRKNAACWASFWMRRP